MYDNFKILNYSNSLVSPELFARHQSRLFSGNVLDGLSVVPKTGLTVTLQPGNAMIPYGSGATSSVRLMSLVADFDITLDTADASNPRIDLIVIYVKMDQSLPGGTPTAANLDGPGVVRAAFVKGTPNASPVDPTVGAIQTAIGASNPYFIAASVRVDAGVSTLAANKITRRHSPVATTNGLALGATSYVDSGCSWSATSGLVGAMTAGLIYFNYSGVMLPVVPASIASKAFTASKDTYVFVDMAGAFTYTEQTNNAVPPAYPANAVLLAIVVTNGSAITSVIDMRPSAQTLGYREITSNFPSTQTASTAASQVLGLTVPVLLSAGQKIKVSAYAPRVSNTTLRNNFLSIWDGPVGTGTLVVETQLTTDPAYVGQLEAKRVYTPGAGTKTYNVSLREDGAGTSSLIASASSPAYLMVERA